MLKHVLAFFVFIVVSLAPVCADEGYIPYFPDFLEPDGIGFRGTAESKFLGCWTTDSSSACSDNPKGTNYSEGETASKASPITLEYRTNYFLKKLFYTQFFFDFGSGLTNGEILEKGLSPHQTSDINTNAFLQEFLTSEEKSLLLSLDTNRILDLETKSNYLSFGVGVGFDLWFLEFSYGPFLMYHDSKVSLRSCSKYARRGGWEGDLAYMPNHCQWNPENIIKLDEQKFSGFAIGEARKLSLVFLQTNNLRISFEFGSFGIKQSWDSNFKPTKYRGLKFHPEYRILSRPNCHGFYHDMDGNKKKVDCKNQQGGDMSNTSDITQGLQITYYFR